MKKRHHRRSSRSRRGRRWLRRVISVLLSVFVVTLSAILAFLILFHSLDDVIVDEDAPIHTTATSTTTTTVRETFMPTVLDGLEYNYISYSSISGYIFSMNTERLYTWCAERAFTSIRGDVRITSDNKLIMHYYESFQFAENGKLTRSVGISSIPVRQLNEEECLRLRYDATDSPICTFADYLKICKKYNKIAFVSVPGEHYAEIIPVLLEGLKEQGMLDRCIINSSSYPALEAIRAADATVALSYQQSHQGTLKASTIDNAAALGGCVVLGNSFGASFDESKIEEYLDEDVISYAKERGVLVYESQVFSATLANKLKEYGIAGVQMPALPALN